MDYSEKQPPSEAPLLPTTNPIAVAAAAATPPSCFDKAMRGAEAFHRFAVKWRQILEDICRILLRLTEIFCVGNVLVAAAVFVYLFVTGRRVR